MTAFRLWLIVMIVALGVYTAFVIANHGMGLVFGLFGLCGGIMFLAPYLLVASYRANGDVKELLLGKTRASA